MTRKKRSVEAEMKTWNAAVTKEAERHNAINFQDIFVNDNVLYHSQKISLSAYRFEALRVNGHVGIEKRQHKPACPALGSSHPCWGKANIHVILFCQSRFIPIPVEALA